MMASSYPSLLPTIVILLVASHGGLPSLTLPSVEASPVSTSELVMSNGPRVEIKPELPIFLVEAQAISKKVLTCKALGDKPYMFSQLKWSGPDRDDNSDELAKKHKIVETGFSVELEFRRPTPDDSGIYRCHGTYQSTVPLNASVAVKVYNPIKLENCPERQFVVENSQNQMITCRITGDSSSVVFLKDNVQIDKYKNRYKWDNEDKLQILGRVNEQDAGVYEIQVTADLTGDRIVQYINVEVHSKPKIAPYVPRFADSIAEFTGVEGERTELKCNATGNPSPLVYWFDPKYRRNVTSLGGYHSNHEQGTLIIDRVNRDNDNGNFECLAINDVDQARRNVSMAVLQRPAIIVFENKTVEEGSEAILECRATGFPKPSFSIRKEGLNQVPYRPGDGKVTDVDEAEEGGGVQYFIYRIKVRASRASFGLHYCNATNSAGSSEKVGKLFVKYKPDLSHTNSRQSFKMGKNFTLTCHVEAFPKPVVTFWDERNQQITSTQVYSETSPDEQTHVVRMTAPPLFNPHVTRFKCLAKNEMGEAERLISPILVRPPGAVDAVIQEVTPTTVKLQLSVRNDGGDLIKAYKYEAEGTTMDIHNPILTIKQDRQNETYIDAAPTLSTYTLRNLRPYYHYRIMIRAINDIGEGEVSEVGVETKRPSPPDPPLIDTQGLMNPSQPGFISEYQNAYLLKWRAPDLDNGDPVLKYKIYFNKVNPDSPNNPLDVGQQRIVEQMHGRPFEAKVGPLETNQYYRIQLKAQNGYGDSRPAQIVIYTPPDRPAMPDIGPQPLTWLTDAPTSTLVAVLILALLLFFIIDVVSCFWCQIGVSFYLRNLCCPAKANSVMSDKTYVIPTRTPI